MTGPISRSEDTTTETRWHFVTKGGNWGGPGHATKQEAIDEWRQLDEDIRAAARDIRDRGRTPLIEAPMPLAGAMKRVVTVRTVVEEFPVEPA